jgi:hypothetical protein
MDGESRLTPLSLKAEPLDDPLSAIMTPSAMQPVYATSSNLIGVPLHQSSLSSTSSASSISGRHSISAGISSGGRKSKKDKPVRGTRIS